MKILITGATGFIGRYLAHALVERNYEVHCLVRKTSSIEPLKNLRLKFVYGDLTKIDTLYEAVADKEYIYHLATAANPRDINTYYQVNHIGTENRNFRYYYHLENKIFLTELKAKSSNNS